ncbi:MAG: hypothetical protein E6G66_12920 [Actinobacteria bacterium]|nr:MAG: hypothetical protein E6G66_12920 [Actinomycetota bacterium]
MITLRLRLRKARDGQEGSALVLALIFLAILAVGMTALLVFADTSIRATVGLRSQEGNSYAADGAVNAAINAIRGDKTQGVAGGPCTLPSVSANGVTPTVTCVGLPGSGASTSDSTSDTPGQAILTLSTSTSEDGFLQQSNNQLWVGGHVASNSTIVVNTGPAAMHVTGTVAAAGNCPGPGTILSSVAGYPQCNKGAGAIKPDPGVGDSTYDPPAPVATVRTPPASCSGGTVTLLSGTYQSAAALTNLTSGACTVVFSPGVYLFSFIDPSPVWSLSNKNALVIGGTRSASGCDASVANGGVQFMFDGQSRLSMGAGTMSLCASPTTAHQRIALYGLKPSPVTGTVLAASASSSGSPSFSNTANALALDGSSASATLSSNSANLTLQNYASPAIPAGATIDRAILRVRHAESATGNMNLSLSATTGGNPVLGPTFVPVCTSPCADFSSSDLSTALNTPTKIAALQIQYMATNTRNGTRTANVDGIVLDVTYHTTPYAGESGCIVTPGAGACSLISTSGNQTNLFITGTVYAPLARFDIALPNQSQQIFGRGVIARSLYVTVPSSAGGGATIYAPVVAGTPVNANRDVLFTAKLGGAVVLSARAQFDDTTNPSKPGVSVTVKAWSVRR